MRNLTFLTALFFVLSCSKNSSDKEETIIPTASEKKIIEAAEVFFKSSGDYDKIQNNYRVALSPVLTVRRALTEGPLTGSIFQECCCPWIFSASPYDISNGNVTSYLYPKSVLFSPKPGKMEGNISASFERRPVFSDRTELQYVDLSFIGTNINLKGTVYINDVVVSPYSNNVMCNAEFCNNSFAIPSAQITSITGNLSFSDGDAAGKLNVNYSDDKSIMVEIFTTTIGNSFSAFRQIANFTTEGVTAEINFDQQTIRINGRTFKLSL